MLGSFAIGIYVLEQRVFAPVVWELSVIYGSEEEIGNIGPIVWAKRFPIGGIKIEILTIAKHHFRQDVRKLDILRCFKRLQVRSEFVLLLFKIRKENTCFTSPREDRQGTN
jgi:hypothetical protein